MSVAAFDSESSKWRFLFSRYFETEFVERFRWFLQEQHGPICPGYVSRTFAGTAELHPFGAEADLTVACEHTVYDPSATCTYAAIGVHVMYFAFDHEEDRRERNALVVSTLQDSPRLQGLFQGMQDAAEEWVLQTSGNFSVIFSAGPSQKILVGKHKILFLHGVLERITSTFDGTSMFTWNPKLKLGVVHKHDKDALVSHVQEAIWHAEGSKTGGKGEDAAAGAHGIFEVDPCRLFRSMQRYYKPRFLVFMAGLHPRSSRKAPHHILSKDIAQRILLLTVPEVVEARNLESVLLKLCSE